MTADLILGTVDRLADLIYFKPHQQQIIAFREVAVSRMSTCSLSRQVFFLDAKIHQSILDGSDHYLRGDLVRHVEEVERELRARMRQSSNFHEHQQRLGNSLEVHGGWVNIFPILTYSNCIGLPLEKYTFA